MGSTSDKRQKLLPTNDKTRKKIPITGTWTDIIYFFFSERGVYSLFTNLPQNEGIEIGLQSV